MVENNPVSNTFHVERFPRGSRRTRELGSDCGSASFVSLSGLSAFEEASFAPFYDHFTNG